MAFAVRSWTRQSLVYVASSLCSAFSSTDINWLNMRMEDDEVDDEVSAGQGPVWRCGMTGLTHTLTPSTCSALTIS